MNEKYKAKLIEKAKEIQEIQGALMTNRYDMIMEKVNQLVGYILALEEEK